MKFNPAWRLRFLSIVFILVAALFLVRLFFIQVVRAEYYQDQGDRQYLRPSASLFDRGGIYFSWKNGQVFSAATLKTGFILAINPKLVTDPETTYQKLSPILALDKEDFMKKAAKKSDPYEELANRLEQQVADKIKALELPGVYLYKERWRFYPSEKSASHVIGLMGYKGDKYEGRYGLEKLFDPVLSRNTDQNFANFFVEMFVGVGKTLSGSTAKSQGDLVLTIEPQVQKFFEGELSKVKEKWSADQAAGIIMDPKTGEILAMAALPNFHPGEKQADISYLSNPLVENVYEMGSIVKPLTMAAGLDAGVVRPSTTYKDEGTIYLNSKKISNYDGKARGVVPMQEVLSQSLNTGVAFVTQRLGHDRFRKYMLGFGLGDKTGIDLPGEISGLVNNLNSSREVEYATASFGQGIAVTPVEMTRALAVLGNGGYLVTPHVIKRIEYKSKLVDEIEPTKGPQVIKKETSDEITQMLVTVVDKALAGGKISLPRYSVAAKTGTAQMASPSGGYYPDRYLHSFFGYFPAYNPRFLVFMYIVYPKGVKYSSETLTEPFTNTSKFLLNYYEVPPDR